MENTIDGSSDSDEDFHSASDNPSVHRDLKPSADLLAIPLAIACVRFHQRTRLQNEVLPLPLFPLGLPPLTQRMCKHTDAIIKGRHHNGDALAKSADDSFQQFKQAKKKRSFTATPEEIRSTAYVDHIPSVRASHDGGYQECSSDSKTDSPSPVPKLFASTEQLPSSAILLENVDPVKKRDELWVVSDEDDEYLPKRMQLREDFQWAPLEKHELEQSLAKQKLEAAQDGEPLAHSSNTSQDSEGSSCLSNIRMLDADEGGDDDDTIGQSIREIMDMNSQQARKLSDDFQPSSMPSNIFLKARPCGPTHTQQDKERLWASNIEFNTFDRKGADIIRDGSHVSEAGGAIPNRSVIESSNGEDLREASPEQGQLNSLLLWPVGLAVEAIAFQVRLIAQAFSLVAVLFNWCNSFASNRVRETLQVRERASEALNQQVTMISNVPPKVTESGSMVLKRAGWGCCAALYVCILLSMLLFPTLLLDYVFVNKIVEEPVNVKEPLHFDYTLPHPTAVVHLHPATIGKLARQSERARPIPVGHKVHIKVSLTLPESDYNRELGMFQLSAQLLSETGQIIKSSSRPYMLRFHSLPIRMLKTFLFSLPSLLGMFTESQMLVVHLMEFEEQQVATCAVRILVQPKAGMPLGQGIPEIYSAEGHIETHLPWLKSLIRSWKWTVYIWTGLMLYVMEIIMILCCCRQALVPKALFSQNDESRLDEAGGDNSLEGQENGISGDKPRTEQGPIRHYSLEEHIPVARAVLHRRERKLSPGGYPSISSINS